MLWLISHGVHLVLLVSGLLGVVALLAPHLLEQRRRRDAGTGASPQHAQRMALLRADLASLENSPASPGPTYDGTTARVLMVVSSVAAATVHAVVAPHHAEEGVLLGAFFVVAAVCQGVWALWASRRVDRPLLLVGLAGNVALMVLWAWTRLVGLPWGLLAGPERAGAWDLACLVWEAAVALTCVLALRRGARREDQLPLGYPGAAGWSWAGASGAALLVLSLTASVD